MPISIDPDHAIAGTAVLPIRKYFEPEEDMVSRCIVRAVADAGLRRQDIGGIICCKPRPSVVQQYFAQHVGARLGLDAKLCLELDAAGMSLSLAIRIAAEHMRTRGLKAIAIAAAVRDSAISSSEYYEGRTMRGPDASFVGSLGISAAAWYALAYRELMDAGESDENELARIAVRLRRSAVDNELAYFRSAVTEEQVLASRMISDPLRLMMCCPRSDGAGAVIVARRDVLVRPERAVAVLAQGYAQDNVNVVPDRAGVGMSGFKAAALAAREAFTAARLQPADIDLVEPWAPFAAVEVLVMRALGFPADYVQHVSVSTSGGLVARGHPPIATGFYNLHEVVQQLRGEAGERQLPQVRRALTTGEAGNYNGCSVDIFGRLS